ncbi:uncharacterized protein LOC126950428 [Macaca thibetana thibetana]|uniref:uncharacterized protein LOC126950428 n=1 Tax=Macaca thibetana thibetana TaxID=257877 RepID=UPI0021BCA512|nr:uncharacterized protein LOC126950428 [Macaca thibetana thibetana]
MPRVPPSTAWRRFRSPSKRPLPYSTDLRHQPAAPSQRARWIHCFPSSPVRGSASVPGTRSLRPRTAWPSTPSRPCRASWTACALTTSSSLKRSSSCRATLAGAAAVMTRSCGTRPSTRSAWIPFPPSASGSGRGSI